MPSLSSDALTSQQNDKDCMKVCESWSIKIHRGVEAYHVTEIIVSDYVKALSDKTIFTHDSLQFASGGCFQNQIDTNRLFLSFNHVKFFLMIDCLFVCVLCPFNSEVI